VRSKFRISLGDRAGAKMDMLKADEFRKNGLSGSAEVYGAKAA